MRRRIDSFMRSTSSSIALASSFTATGVNGMSQYCFGSARAWPRLRVSVKPGGSL